MISIRPVAICLTTLLAVGACSKKDNSGQALAQDSSLTRDLQMANADTSAQPQLKDVAATSPATPPPAPARAASVRPTHVAVAPPPRKPVRVRTPEPAPARVAQAPPPEVSRPVPTAPTTTASGNTVTPAAGGAGNGEGTVGVVAAGTSLTLSSGQRVCTNTNTVGDRLTATLAEAVTASNGVVIPAGATAVLEVSSLARSNQAGENMDIGFVVRSITYGGKTYPVNGQIVSADVVKVKAADNNDATKVAGGAVVGAILGRIFGGSSKTRGTIIGAAGGAAAGAVLAHQTEKYDACLPSGGRVVVRLDSPMSVQASGAANGVI